MNIFLFVMVICPGIISAEYYERLKKMKFTTIQFIEYSAIFTVILNLITIFIIQARGWESLNMNTLGVGLIFKYLLMNFVFAYIMPHCYAIVSYIIGRYITGSIKKED